MTSPTALETPRPGLLDLDAASSGPTTMNGTKHDGLRLDPVSDMTDPSRSILEEPTNNTERAEGREDEASSDAGQSEAFTQDMSFSMSSHSLNGQSVPSDSVATSPDSTAISSTSQNPVLQLPTNQIQYNTLHVPPAQLGLGTLAGEEQLKSSLQGKDRIFLLVLAKEVENFISKTSAALTGSELTEGAPRTLGTSAGEFALEPSMTVKSVATSKYQRMLVYKTAEWFGLKAVSSVDGGMTIGVMANLDEKSTGLRLVNLSPRPPSPAQQFKIMRRAAPNSSTGEAGSSRSTSVSGEDSESGPSRAKTIEEREQAYAAARAKIYGHTETAESSVSREEIDAKNRSSQGRIVVEEPDLISRHIGLVSNQSNSSQWEPVYPSIYHPPQPEYQQAARQQMINPPQFQPQSSNYAYQPMPFTSYAQMPDMQSMGGFSGTQPSGIMAPNGNQFVTSPQLVFPQHGPQYAMQASQLQYTNRSMTPVGSNGFNHVAQQPNAYGQNWQGEYPGPPKPNPKNPQSHMALQTAPMGGQWYGNTAGNISNQHVPMPGIPQGMAYPQYGYPPKPQMSTPIQNYQNHPQPHPGLMQPTPTRPSPHHHSSTSSSISSRSYQDGSRPHSRGSTTSTRSGASSVRLGAMYPVGSQIGYGRQKAMNSRDGMGMTNMGFGEEAVRRPRGHSPASTTSSRSSRRAPSLPMPHLGPNQHPLPQRPDWSANNVPYHPSPLPLPGTQQSSNTSDFPPLLRKGTNAEPMQVERARAKPVNGTVWNGAGVKALQSGSTGGGGQGGNAGTAEQTVVPLSPRSSNIIQGSMKTPNPLPLESSMLTTPLSPASENDPDFPRRNVVAKVAPVLYDPVTGVGRSPLVSTDSNGESRPTSASASKIKALINPGSVSTPGIVPPSMPTSTNGIANAHNGHGFGNGNNANGSNVSALSIEDTIEARLAAVSLSSGVSIGPPVKNGGLQGPVGSTSYAKIVRRD